jgi:hypothetical protein
MKHLIIGCGISGIHIAIQLIDKGENPEDILILEKEDYNCSKFFTITEYNKNHEKIILEMGPSVMHSNQKELMTLINRLDLLGDLEKVNPKAKAFFVYPGLTSDQTKTIWKELKKKVFEIEDYNITLKEASKLILTKKEYDILKTCWGEWYEMCDCNLQILKKSLNEQGEYLIMKNGFDRIIEKGVEFILKKGVNIQFENGIIKINEDLSVVDSKGYIHYPKKLYICANYKGVKNIKIGIPLVKEYLNMGKSKHCMRFYVNFKKDIDIPYKFLFGNFLGKFSIKSSNRLWLIAYPDGELAARLNKLSKRSIIKDWLRMVNSNFNLSLKIKDIDFIKCVYWDDAYTILTKEGVDKADKLQEELRKENIIITCLPKFKGDNTAWIEGHLYKV